MKKATYKRGSKRMLALFSALTLAVSLVLVGTFAWLSYSGNMGGRGASSDRDRKDKMTPVPGEFLGVDDSPPAASKEPIADPFTSQYSSTETALKNANSYPIIVRASIVEIQDKKNKILVDYALRNTVPSEYVAVKMDTDYSLGDWTWVRQEALFVNGEACDSVSKLHAFYRTNESGEYEFFVASCFYDPSLNWNWESFKSDWQKVECDAVQYTLTAQGALGKVCLLNPKCVFTEWSDQNHEKLPWGASVNLVKYEKDLILPAKHPTLEGLVEDWNAGALRGAAQLDSRIPIVYSHVSKTPVKDNWFYNEQDGYFYYVGLIAPGGIAPRFFTLDTVQTFKVLDGPGYVSSFSLNSVGEVIEAEKEAAAALWGLTFEPGSLGAAIFGE
ncbi:MAG: hypothetical protein FWC27_06285 [Firmicutes bacterium]|nr:hypothetical protein [Bacillota bacterium]